MHSKRLGNIGELKVASFLVGLQLSVFKELGDISKVDLVVEYCGNLIGIQVKAIHKEKGRYPVTSKKSGSGYRFKYTEKDCAVFAIYCVDDDKIAWLKSSEITGSRCNLSLRVDDPKNNQTKGVSYLDDYLDVMRVLRDYEQGNQTENAVVDDIVQTTTLETRASES